MERAGPNDILLNCALLLWSLFVSSSLLAFAPISWAGFATLATVVPRSILLKPQNFRSLGPWSKRNSHTTMKNTAVNLSRRALKQGRKSGVLPEVRPIFRHNPIRPKTESEKAAEAKIEQGYADGVPLPKRKGFSFSRFPKEKPVVTVEERIQRVNSWPRPTKPESEMTEDEKWALKRDELRREHLKEAYLKESKRLEKVAQLEARKQQETESRQASKQLHMESEATRNTLPTIDSYLKGPIMRHRTPEEQELVEEKRLLNRKTRELEVMNDKTKRLLELYHAAGKFITTEEELSQAITEAFEIKVGRFESSERLIEDKLFGYANSFASTKSNEQLIRDEAYGEINGQPGVDQVKDHLSGEAEKMRREAQRKLNYNS